MLTQICKIGVEVLVSNSTREIKLIKFNYIFNENIKFLSKFIHRMETAKL